MAHPNIAFVKTAFLFRAAALRPSALVKAYPRAPAMTSLQSSAPFHLRVSLLKLGRDQQKDAADGQPISPDFGTA